MGRRSNGNSRAHRLAQAAELRHHRRKADEDQTSGQGTDARDDERGAEGELIDWNAESDGGNTHRGNHDPQQGQQYRHVYARSAVFGSGHDAMVTKEFRPRCGPTAITNVALPRPNPILINAGSDALTPRQARWMTLVIARHANAFKFGSKTLVAKPAVTGGIACRCRHAQNADSIRCPGARSGLMS